MALWTDTLFNALIWEEESSNLALFTLVQIRFSRKEKYSWERDSKRSRLEEKMETEEGARALETEASIWNFSSGR